MFLKTKNACSKSKRSSRRKNKGSIHLMGKQVPHIPSERLNVVGIYRFLPSLS